jgi:CRISPR-associated protein Csm1
MSNSEDLAIAGLLHDIGKFGQRAEIELRSSQFSKSTYNYLHAAFSAQIIQDYFDIDDTLADYSAMHHNLSATDGSDEYWVVATADRLSSGFERENFEQYNDKSDHENEDYKTQRLWHIFDKKEEYKIAPLSVDNIFKAASKSKENEYKQAWQSFLKDLEQIDKGNRHTDLATMEYLLKKHTTFMPSSTTFNKGGYDAVRANIPLYDHLKTTALFAGAIEAMEEKNKTNVLNYYKKESNDPEQNDFMLIAGDFFGIQSFIFDSIEAKRASKILRAKSAYIQILTKVIAIALAKELGLSRLSIISDSAGKFEILAPTSEKNKKILISFQTKLNKHFVKEFYGQTGIGVSFVECSLADFLGKEDKSYKALRENLAKEVEKSKFKKFNLQKEDNYKLGIDKDLDNQTLCPLCHLRKKTSKESCDSCGSFVKIGKELSRDNYLAITKDETDIEIFDGYYIKFTENPKVFTNSIAIYDLSNKSKFRGFAKWELSSYVAKEVDKEDRLIPKSFENLAKASVSVGKQEEKREHGVEALMALKGDVDSMGQFIKDSDVTNSFAKFNFFSRMVDYYFSVYVPHLMQENYPNTYTVFAGGDDLFILGAWDEVIDLSKKIRQDFMAFCENKLSFSVGMVMTKANKPVNFIAQACEEQLEKAKEHKKDGKEKDALSLFGETAKWSDYLDDNGLMEELSILSDNTAILYRLLDLTQMGKNVKDGYIEDTIWKSKLNYSFYRNMDMTKERNKQFLNNLNTMIEKYPKETKMFLSEFIYKRRVS